MNEIPAAQVPAAEAGAESGPGTGAPAVIVWVAEATWGACVDAARDLAPVGATLVLLHVTPDEIPEAAHGAYAGLLGRGHPERDPGTRLEGIAASTAAALLDAAARRLGRPCTRVERRGRVEREVIAAADAAALLILARDGDCSRLGPRSLGREGRFVVDHAPCPVLLVWPETAPGIGTLPPPPPHGPGQPHPPDLPHGPAQPHPPDHRPRRG